MQSPQDTTLQTARAFTTYSLVPYLGILFCPGAIGMGAFVLVQSFRVAGKAQPRSAHYAWFALASFVLMVQIVLWWVLYKVPQWTQTL